MNGSPRALRLLVPPEFDIAWPWLAPNLARARAFASLAAEVAGLRESGRDVELRACAGRTAQAEAAAAGTSDLVAVVAVPGVAPAVAAELCAALVAASVRLVAATPVEAAAVSGLVESLGQQLAANQGAVSSRPRGSALLLAPSGTAKTLAPEHGAVFVGDERVSSCVYAGVYGAVSARTGRIVCDWPPQTAAAGDDLHVLSVPALARVEAHELGARRVAVARRDGESLDDVMTAVAAVAADAWPGQEVAIAAARRLLRSCVDLELQMFAGNSLLARNRELLANIVP